MKLSTPSFVNKAKIYGFIDKNFSYLALVAVVLIVGLGMYYIVYPRWQNVQGVELLRVQETEQKLAEAEEYLADLKSMRDRYAMVDYNDIQRLSNVLPREFDEESIFFMLQDFGQRSGFSVTDVSIQTSSATQQVATDAETRRRTTASAEGAEVVDVGTIREIDISLNVSGVDNYSSFKKLLGLIENHSPLLDLSEVRWPSGGQSLTLELTSYYLAEL